MGSDAEVSLNYEYFYRLEDESAIEPTLDVLENELGGRRHALRGMGNGLAINIIALIEILVSIVGLWILKPMVQKYVEGLVGLDDLKELGQKHRSELLSWLARLEARISGMLPALSKILTLRLPLKAPQKPEQAIALKFSIRPISLYVVLNHAKMSDRLIEALPEGVRQALQALVAGVLPPDAKYVQLYLDPDEEKWQYLLVTKIVPITDGRGVEILAKLEFSGYVDVKSLKFIKIDSAEQFKILFRPSVKDRWKFLADIFNEES